MTYCYLLVAINLIIEQMVFRFQFPCYTGFYKSKTSEHGLFLWVKLGVDPDKLKLRFLCYIIHMYFKKNGALVKYTFLCVRLFKLLQKCRLMKQYCIKRPFTRQKNLGPESPKK